MSTKIWLIIAFVILMALGIWFFFFRSTYDIQNVPMTKMGPILVFGDSLAEGVGASNGKDLASQLAITLGEPVLNYGVAGDTTVKGIARLSTAREENPRLVLIILGGNDFLQKIPRAETFANLESIIEGFQADGAAVLLIGVRSGIIGGGADEEYEAVAEKTGAAYEKDVLSGVFGDAELMSDAIHPNDAGYQKIVERLLPTVKELLGK